MRAPKVGELFSGLSQTFPSGLTDPCDGIGASGGGALGDNPDLGEETATSWTVGAVIQPRSIEALSDFTLTVDCYTIKVDDVVASFPRQFILDQCYAQGNPILCPLVIRRPGATATDSAGSIEFINALSVNAATLETDGIDAFRIAFTGTCIGAASEDDQFCSAFGLDEGSFRQGTGFWLDTQLQYHASDNLQLNFLVPTTCSTTRHPTCFRARRSTPPAPILLPMSMTCSVAGSISVHA